MSTCTTGTCLHDRGVFIWLADGPWLGDPADPDYGRYPWVHDTSVSPGHLEVCDLKPFATAEETGEAREARTPAPDPESAREADVRERLDLGEAVPGGPGACTRDGCHHYTMRHRQPRSVKSYRRQPCRECRCPRWTDEVGAEMPPAPAVQLRLFGDAA